MSAKEKLSSLKGYLRRQKWVILLFAGLLSLVFIIYWLYGLPWGPVIYVLLLMGAIFLGAGVLGLREYNKKAVRLTAAEKEAKLCIGELPPPWDSTEEQYQRIIRNLETRCLDSERKTEETLKNASEYYILWSHQVKTPLSAMRLLLREDPLDRQALEQELFKIEQYVGMALQYQRLGKGFDDLVLQEQDLERLCKEAVKRTAPLFIHKKIGIRLGNLSLRVLTDEKWLCFVLEQLLTNAVKYTKEGTVTLALSETRPDTLVVSDTGIGILPEDLPRVFEWGYTGCNGRMDKRSTGIGLALCRQAMGLLGHSISIESTVGKGTQVMLCLGRRKLPIE